MNTTTAATSPDTKLIEDLKEFSHCRKTLSLPYTVLRYFIDGCAIYYTDLGYRFCKIEPHEREFFFYGVFEDINNLTHGDGLPDSIKSKIAGLEALDSELKKFGLFSMAHDEKEDEYLLFFEPAEVYISICQQDIPFISNVTLEYFKGLEPNKPSNPYMVYLEKDGSIVK